MKELVEEVRNKIKNNPDFLFTEEAWVYIREKSRSLRVHPAVILMLIVTETRRAKLQKCDA